MNKLRHQKQFSHRSEKLCELIYPDRKKLACAELSAAAVRPLPYLMPFTICIIRASHKTEFLDRGKTKGYILVVLWFLCHNCFTLARSEILTWLHVSNYRRGLSGLAPLSFQEGFRFCCDQQRLSHRSVLFWQHSWNTDFTLSFIWVIYCQKILIMERTLFI